MVFFVADCSVAVRRDLVIGLSHWRGNSMGVEIASGLRVYQANNILVSYILDRVFRIVQRLVPVRVEEPIVIGILVMVAGHLLLLRTFGVRLDMRM